MVVFCVLKRKHGDLGVFLDGWSQSLRETRLTGPIEVSANSASCLPACSSLTAGGGWGVLWTPPICGIRTWHVQWFLPMLVEVATA